ncbi:hypothetical protein ACHRVW_01695 [Flavobacterium collinsii]|jgi:hypothetical protein|uniref:O-antigen ligase n=1 Tax=Flavobacterium collinsii TaxID=1114861 RepID=A0A9W4THD1_9FLAO|nr:hypothetical protein [Flavobacterium collinsii]GIQ58880.1 hypothetical protein Flavo103_20160 [Flavobacterium collinsii]CAI2766042.1 conserved membrane protein of unknown function [Flavobacterium collinsii]
MNITIYKSFPYQILFLLCIGVSLFANYELTFAVWTLTLLATIKRKYSVTIIKYCFIFLLILLVAIVSTLFSKTTVFLFVRDFTYLFKPILGLLVGYQLCRFSSKLALKVIVYTGLAISLMHLAMLFFTVIEFRTLSVNLLREHGGYFSDYEIYVLIILIFYKNLELEISKRQRLILMSIIGLSSFLYLARTNLIQFIILYVGLKGYLIFNKKSLRVILFVLLGTVIGYTAIVYINPKREGKGIQAFLYKIKIAPQEAFKTRIDKEDWKDFNDNYRSFENIIAVKQVSDKGKRAVFFGEGLGSTLNLGRKVWTNDHEYVQYIPIVHNGYMTVFLKSGLLGVLLLLVFLIALYRQKKSDIEAVQAINYLLIGSSVFLIVSNWVFLGLYLKLDNKSIIIGFLIALREIIVREYNSQNRIENEE